MKDRRGSRRIELERGIHAEQTDDCTDDPGLVDGEWLWARGNARRLHDDDLQLIRLLARLLMLVGDDQEARYDNLGVSCQLHNIGGPPVRLFAASQLEDVRARSTRDEKLVVG